METQQAQFPVWMRGVLLLMAAYNVFWGVFIAWFPNSFYEWVVQVEAEAPGIITWQGRGVLAMAVVYFIAALHPGKFWYLILFGAFTKLAGGIWFYFDILDQQVGDKALFHLIMNDGIWIPLLIAMMLKALAYKKALALRKS